MKITLKKFLWALGIFAVIGFIGNANSSQTAVQGTQTTITPTVEAVATPTLEPTVTNTPIPTKKPVYVAPTATSDGLSNDNYYINSAGNEVHSPAYSNSVPAGASAICGDGTYSFSQSRRGTCSYHGGVLQWL